MQKLLEIAEQVIQLLPDELFFKYEELRSRLLEEPLQNGNNLEGRGEVSSFRDNLALYQYLRSKQVSIAIQTDKRVVDCELQRTLAEIKQMEEEQKSIRYLNSEIETDQSLVHFCTETDDCAVFIKEVQTDMSNEQEYQELCELCKCKYDENEQESLLYIKQSILEYKNRIDQLEKQVLKEKLEEKSYSTQEEDFESIIRQLMIKIDNFKEQEKLQKQQEVEISQLKETVDELTIKLQESGIMQKQAESAYFTSIEELRQESEEEIEKLQIELANTHDRLRKMEKSVESIDSSVFSSIISV